MRVPKSFVQKIPLIVSLLFILLFVYAAVSKLLDFENFKVQLGQSPMLSVYAGEISWFVPIVELLLVIVLIIPKTRVWGLFGSFLLMVMFTVYIYIILHYSSFVPCSCGGVLEKLSWNSHMIFNVFFIALALVGLYAPLRKTKYFKLGYLVGSVSIVIGCITLVILLFISSEDRVHLRNPFVRRFPHHPVTLIAEKDLQMNSYFLAGLKDKIIYLGNHTAPLLVLKFNEELEQEKPIEIKTTGKELPYRSIQLKVEPPYFYLTDGTIPYVLRGKTDFWKADYIPAKGYFSLAIPIDSNTIAIRTRASKTHEKVIGLLPLNIKQDIKLNDGILSKQIDGVFDTDGIMVYNRELEKLIYTYFYRNNYLIINPDLSNHIIGKTIDTISIAQITIASLPSNNRTEMTKPPLTVNKTTATYGNYLFVHSGIMGLFEPKDTWNRSSVIDIYNLSDQSYVFSFYIPKRGKNPISELRIENDFLVSMAGNYIQTYRFDSSLLKKSYHKSIGTKAKN